MSVSLKHRFVDLHSDEPDSSIVRPSNWNDEHNANGSPNQLFGFDNSGVGVSIFPGAGLTLSGNVLTAASSGLSPGGANLSVQYNNSGAFGGYTNIQLTALIQPFTSTLSGAAPSSGGGSTNFLRADGTWAVPPSTATAPAGSNLQVQYNNSGSFGAYTNIQLTALIQTFTSTLSGAAPASGGGTANFLRADGSWAAPAGGAGTVTSIAAGTGITVSPSPIIGAGTVSLANPSATTIGGVQSVAAVASQWINSISTSGVPALSQPAFTNISGTIAVSQLPAGGAPRSQTLFTGTSLTLSTEQILVCDCSAAATLTLPSAAGRAGQQITIKDSTGKALANPITINRAGSDLIDGQTSYVLQNNRAGVTLVPTTVGTAGWMVL